MKLRGVHIRNSRIVENKHQQLVKHAVSSSAADGSKAQVSLMLGSVESGTENVTFDHVTTARLNYVEREDTRSPKTVSPLELPQELCKIVDD